MKWKIRLPNFDWPLIGQMSVTLMQCRMLRPLPPPPSPKHLGVRLKLVVPAPSCHCSSWSLCIWCSARICLTLTYSTWFAGLTSLFTCGGYPAGNHLAEAEVTDLTNKACNEVPEMPNAKYCIFAMWDDSDESVLCCGGYDDDSSMWRRCYEYSADAWTDLGDILVDQRRFSSAVKLSDGRYWISGGFQGYKWINFHFILLGDVQSWWSRRL